jgi:hypothetical protein
MKMEKVYSIETLVSSSKSKRRHNKQYHNWNQSICVHYTFEPAYTDIDLHDTSSIMLDIL